MPNKENVNEKFEKLMEEVGERKKRAKDSIRQDAHAEYLSSISPLTTEEKKDVPNIIFILMDDLGWGDLSCFGSKAIHTPNLDRMAEEGLIMENCYSSSPVCSPSRFGLMTGRYPSRGFIKNVFFPTVEIEERHMVVDRGYETPEELAGGRPSREAVERARQASKFIGGAIPVEGIMPDEVTVAEILQARGYRTGMFGKWHLGDKEPHLPNNKGFDYFYGAHYSNDMVPYHFWRNEEIAVEAPFDQSKITEYLNTEFFKFIEDNSDGPFFAYYASPWPHHPLNSGEKFKGTSKGGVYGDCIEEFDHGIGQLFDLLKEKGLLDNTFIAFSSDNGPWHQGSPGGHRGRKGNAFDGGQVVPTICYWKDKVVNGTIREQAMNIDFLPTFSEMAGVELPKDRIIDGKSILSLLKGETKESPHDCLIYVDPGEYEDQGFGVRSQDNFKYYKATNSENATYKNMMIHSFLFDLDHDRDESYDVKALYPEKYKELREHLDDFNESIKKNPRGWK
ncbi:MAG TPA: sulfatase-like hydrolase/transferase [Clostridia bacterium]|nr:sulfatase-like hydrolase/transferase [Clostridia bacterium]